MASGATVHKDLSDLASIGCGETRLHDGHASRLDFMYLLVLALLLAVASAFLALASFRRHVCGTL